MTKLISQREGRRLRRRVAELVRIDNIRHTRWSSDYPGGTNICTVAVDAVSFARIDTASMLKCAIVVKPYDGKLLVYAVDNP